MTGCPHCGGNLLLERETEGMILKCFQCGWMPRPRNTSALIRERNAHNSTHGIGWRIKRFFPINSNLPLETSSGMKGRE